LIAFDLTDEQKQLRETARDFTAKEIIPVAGRYDEAEEFPTEVLRKAWDIGLMNLEAMRASKPVVASFWGGPSDVVRDGLTGYLVNPLQSGALADRLTRILQDQESALRMGREGRKRAEESFSEGLLEHPHYTRPAEWDGRRIPDVVMSGNHAAIATWRRDEAERLTKERRPDLWRAYEETRMDPAKDRQLSGASDQSRKHREHDKEPKR